MLAQLLPVKGGDPITLDRPVTVVGRSSRICDLRIDDTRVSKLHCILVKTDGLVYMRDLGSTNGTRVNGQRVLRGALLPGDQISFSGAVYQIHLGPDDEPPTGDELDDNDLGPDKPEASEPENGGAAVNTMSDVRLISTNDQVNDDDCEKLPEGWGDL